MALVGRFDARGRIEATSEAVSLAIAALAISSGFVTSGEARSFAEGALSRRAASTAEARPCPLVIGESSSCSSPFADASAALRFFFWDFVSGAGGGAPGTMRRAGTSDILQHNSIGSNAHARFLVFNEIVEGQVKVTPNFYDQAPAYSQQPPGASPYISASTIAG
jgi:hypothetical protein